MLERMIRLARVLRLLCWLGVILLLLVPSVALALRIEAAILPADLVAWALGLVPNAAVAWGFLQLGRFYGALGARGVFSAQAAQALGRFGWALVAGSLLFPASRVALFGLLSLPWGLVASPVMILAVALGLTLGLTLVVFSAILAEATRLARENAEFV